jgi:hypothetical protein
VGDAVPWIIRQLPIPVAPTPVSVPGGTVTILPFQVVVSVSLTSPRVRVLDPATSRFPAVIDTGFNNALLLQEQQLHAWTGLRREHLVRVDAATAYGQAVAVHAAKVWVHRNVAGRREDAAGTLPFGVLLDPGVLVCPPAVRKPRLPLLGMRMLSCADLQLLFDWRRMLVSLRTTPWWFRWLSR